LENNLIHKITKNKQSQGNYYMLFQDKKDRSLKQQRSTGAEKRTK
jgi:hypothetical protein